MKINIGKSTNSIKIIILDFEYNNDTTILFFNNHTQEDKFTYFFNENRLTIIRIDKNEGWEFEHTCIIYDFSTPYEYFIGNNIENTKIINLNGYFPESCFLSLKKNEYYDSFDYTFKNNTLIVNRIDKNEGWGHDHIFQVFKNNNLKMLFNQLNFSNNYINIGSSVENEKKILLNKCYDKKTIIFFKSHNQEERFTYDFNDNELTIKRIDKNEGWVHNHFGYAYTELLSYQLNIGNSLINPKTIPFDYYFPEDCNFKLKDNEYSDCFDFNLNNNSLLVNRRDIDSGWDNNHICIIYKKHNLDSYFQMGDIIEEDINNLVKICDLEKYIEIGSSETNCKKIILNKTYNKNSIIFLKSHNLDDKFSYFFNENELTIIRIDKNIGWDYHHSGFIYDNLSSNYKYKIGSSLDNTKNMVLNGYFPENCKLDLIEKSFSDVFSYHFKNNFLTITRIDSNEGWGYEHTFDLIKNNDFEKICNLDNLVNIGPSETNCKKIILNKIYPKNSIIFLKIHNFNEKFMYYFNDYELNIIRIDKNEGWEYSHFGFIYDNIEPYDYYIGNSTVNTKILLFDNFFPLCCKLKICDNSFCDVFNCNLENNKIIITRRDNNDGWGHEHKLRLYKDTQLESLNKKDNFINIGSSHTNIKKIMVNKIYDRDTIILFKSHNYQDKFMYFFNQNELTIKRIDKNDGWNFNHSGYIFENEEFPLEYDIGSNFESNNIKIIPSQEYFPEDCVLIKREIHYPDTFNFNFFNNNLIIERTDRNEGWEHNHKATVYKNKISGINMDPNNFININSSMTNEIKIIMNKSYDKNTILFFKTHNYEENFSYFFNQHILTIKRNDKNEGWVHNHIAYIYENNQPYEYNLGVNFDSSEKNIQLYGYYPEYCSLPISIYPYSDKFHFNFKDNLLRIKRVDRNEGWRLNHFSSLNKRKIPNIIFQTHHTDIHEYIKNKIRYKANGWKYLFFNDSDIINFFNNNPINEFPDIVNKFLSIKNGPHKADLFRYYFLFVNGGVFLDSDAELIKNIDDLIKTYEFVTAICRDPSLYFNGLICCPPNHIIVYEALKDMYFMNVDELARDYFKVVRNFKHIVDNFNPGNLKLYKEDGDWTGTMNMVDPENNNEIIIKHYYGNKIIPL